MAREFVYGIHPVREVLRKGERRCRELLVGRSPKDAAVKEVIALARQRGVTVSIVARDEVARKAPGATHQGVVLDAEPLRVLHLEDALGELEIGEHTIWVGLDGITDPYNLGAILRNAACFGATAVLLTERRSAGLTPLVQKVASGAAEYVKVIEAVNLNQSIRKLKDAGFWVYGAAVEGQPIDRVPLHGPAFLVIGAEDTGIRRRTRELCDELAAIPQAPGGVASLNASAASAVLLYAARRVIPSASGRSEVILWQRFRFESSGRTPTFGQSWDRALLFRKAESLGWVRRSTAVSGATHMAPRIFLSVGRRICFSVVKRNMWIVFSSLGSSSVWRPMRGRS
jgi:23S rRNA (guanosine2251-2'-O)-methyltransferase